MEKQDTQNSGEMVVSVSIPPAGAESHLANRMEVTCRLVWSGMERNVEIGRLP